MSVKFSSNQEYADWIAKQEWYQTIDLANGLRTPGKVRTDTRVPILRHLDFAGKRVLDIGCNSGQFSLLAKQLGAREVVGIDIDETRLQQARTLAANEGLEVTFLARSVFDTSELGSFDVVMCFAVLTEIRDFFGGIEAIKPLIGGQAIVETGIASTAWIPLNPRSWLRSRIPGVKSWRAFAEVRRTRRGVYVIHPSMAVIEAAFGSEFDVKRRRNGPRYEVIEVHRTAAR